MPEWLRRADGVRLAYQRTDGRTPTLVFLPGYASDMTGAKAQFLAARARAAGHATLLLDYSAHGQSGGRWADGTIGRWRDDALEAIDRLTDGPLVLAGSSMGGWLALLLALARPGRVRALLGIAAAPDFTERAIRPTLDEAALAMLRRDGAVSLGGADRPPAPITAALLETASPHLLLAADAPIPITCPVRLVHGLRDDAVDPETPLLLQRRLAGTDVRVTLIKDGDHRLSRPADLALLGTLLDELLGVEDRA